MFAEFRLLEMARRRCEDRQGCRSECKPRTTAKGRISTLIRHRTDVNTTLLLKVSTGELVWMRSGISRQRMAWRDFHKGLNGQDAARMAAPCSFAVNCLQGR